MNQTTGSQDIVRTRKGDADEIQTHKKNMSPSPQVRDIIKSENESFQIKGRTKQYENSM